MRIENAKILIVDDELGLREGVKRILTSQGHQVETAVSGIEGIEKGTAQEYDLYFIDLKMPDIEGTQVLRAVKLAYPEAICIIVTAYASIETAIETTRLGAYHYIPKPFSPEEFQILVTRALERRWYILEARRLRTEREKDLLQVAHEKSRIRTIINTIEDGILVINQEGQIVLFNPAFLKLLNIAKHIRIGDSIFEVVPADLQDQIREIFLQKDHFKAINQEITIDPPYKMVLMANTTPILDSNGALLGAVSVLRDISELKKIEVLRSQFVNMAAHELKSPLTAVQGYLEIVADKSLGDAPETYQNYLNRSLERVKSLVNLINDLLNISRLNAGRVRREITRLDLAEIIRERLAYFHDEVQRKELSISAEFGDELTIDADQIEIVRVLNHLIGNAIKYNRPNGSIHIHAMQDGHYIRLAVQDTGIGLQPEEKDRLFEEFFRAKNRYTRNVTGTGLGLSIVKKILDAYAGKITVESEFEKGSTFVIYLPQTASKR